MHTIILLDAVQADVRYLAIHGSAQCMVQVWDLFWLWESEKRHSRESCITFTFALFLHSWNVKKESII